MYESPAYWELKKTVTHWETIQKYADLARTFRSMTYGCDLSLETTSNDGGTGAHLITLDRSLGTDALNFLAQRCEEVAAKLAECPPTDLNIRAACKV